MISSSSSIQSSDVAREFLTIWVAALVIAAGFTIALLRQDPGIYEEYPGSGLPDVDGAEIVVIGSSLTAHLLPGPESAGGVLGDRRTSAMLAVPGISERLTTRLLAHAIGSGAETVLIEINAYVHDYSEYSRAHRGLGEPLFTMHLAGYFRDLGARLTLNFKRLFFAIAHAPVTFYENPVDGGKTALDFAAVASEDYYRLFSLEPAYPDELGKLLEKARAADTEVLFFSPPRPRSAVRLIGSAEFARMVEHVSDVAREFGVPVWYATSAWPDDQFIDIKAHVNARGRDRFLRELSRWYGDRK